MNYYKLFSRQKAQARMRGIAWELPFWEWLQIWEESGHLTERGTHAGQWVMGRNGDQGPYCAVNVQIIRVEKNMSDANITKRRYREFRMSVRAAQ